MAETQSKRFRIALSFPGAKREFVEAVAEHLAKEVGRERVLYDKWYEAEFARPRLATYLPPLYHDQSDLIAVFLCADYQTQEWCGLEWDAIFDLIKKREEDAVMLLRFDDTEIAGLYSTHGYVWIEDRPADEIAELILTRWRQAIGKPAKRKTDTAPDGSPTATELEGKDPPDHQPDPPWKANPLAASKLPRTGEYLVGRASELAVLEDAWANPKTSILQIVAPGGVGKTQLVKKWRESLLDRKNHGGAVRAYDWSFYSQGTQQQASADDFFDRALRWFGEKEPENYKDPWAKGERLAELVKQRRTLLILDGMEPLQHPPGPMAGELTDPSIKALLEGLQRDNPGLCIVTTREAVSTLAEMTEPKRRTIDLGHLSSEAGAELLQRYGVTGDPEELRQASVEVEGHALALILLGTYLKLKCHGDVAQRAEALLFQGHERYAAHAHKVMASYEVWFEREDDIGRAAVREWPACNPRHPRWRYAIVLRDTWNDGQRGCHPDAHRKAKRAGAMAKRSAAMSSHRRHAGAPFRRAWAWHPRPRGAASFSGAAHAAASSATERSVHDRFVEIMCRR